MTDKELSIIRKAQDKQRAGVKKTCQRVMLQFQINRLKTWHDLYRVTGYDETYIEQTFPKDTLEVPITVKEVKAWCSTLTNDLEDAICKHNLGGVAVAKEEVKVEPTANNEATESSTKATVAAVTPPTATIADESGMTSSSDYGLEASPNEKAFLFWFQRKAAKEILDKFRIDNLPAVLLLAATGTGKTYIDAAVDRRLKDCGFDTGKTWGPTSTLLVTRASVVEQTKRVLKNLFNVMHPVDTEVVNIEQLRSRAGEFWIRSFNVIESGEEVEKYEWKPMINPSRIRWDECQALKNDGTIQSMIAYAYSRMPNTTQLFISATPFTRVSEAKAFAIATRKDISHITGIPGQKLSESTWPTYSALIAAPSEPVEYNEAAVERLMKDLDVYIVRVKGVRWQFNALNKVEIIDFEDDERRQEYATAWQKYVNQMAMLEKEVSDNPMIRKLVEQMKFLAAAEYAKRYVYARRMFEDVQSGHAACLAVKFKKTIIGVVKILNEKYGVDREMISLIWGGGQTQMTAKQKLKAKIMENIEVFKEQGISLEDMMLDDVDDRVMEELPEHLRLGNQSLMERQKEIDKFQRGRSLYCIYSFKSGGVGLSLHHTDEFVPQKVRRQKNGYAVVEDIPKIPVRVRKVTISPDWSAIGLVQAVGRVPRLTSLSNSEQTLLFYRGTVEEEQAYVVTHKLKCLGKVVRQHESWQDLISEYAVEKDRARKKAQELVDTTAGTETDEPEQIEGEEGDEKV